MKHHKVLALAAALLLAGVTAASAASMTKSSAAGTAKSPASDSLTLSTAQQKTAWSDLYMGSLNQNAPAGFTAAAGAVLPKSVTAAPVTAKAARAVPALRPYDFATVQKKLVIVNPTDRKIAEVIAG
jgi:hypothetical protein